jgi:hypothetical protein
MKILHDNIRVNGTRNHDVDKRGDRNDEENTIHKSYLHNETSADFNLTIWVSETYSFRTVE